MKNRLSMLVMAFGMLFLLACMLPGMIPLNSSQSEGPMPTMETDANAVIKVLGGQGWHYLQALAPEQYTEEDFAKPGTLKFTVNITDDQPVYFNYGWCAVDEKTLQQNFEHIHVALYINDQELGKDVVHSLAYTSPENLACGDYGVLTSEWPEGNYKLKAVATFDEKINDGMADYEPGDYIFEYDVTVKKQTGGTNTPS